MQFRIVQKRLLVRYKESRNPAPLNSLDKVVDGTHAQLLRLSQRTEEAQVVLLKASKELSCAFSLLLLLCKFKFDLDEANFELLRAYLSPHVEGADDGEASACCGWEERTDAAMTFLLRTSLSKLGTDSGVRAMPRLPLPLSILFFLDCVLFLSHASYSFSTGQLCPLLSHATTKGLCQLCPSGAFDAISEKHKQTEEAHCNRIG